MDLATAAPGSVLEIGHAPFLARCRPDLARFVAVGTRDPGREAVLVLTRPAAAVRLPALARMLADPALRLVACRIHHRPGAAWRLVSLLLRRACRVPIVLLDFEDETILHPAHRPLAVRAHRIFKRELPADRRVLERDPDAQAIAAALRPLPLGLPFGAPFTPLAPKTTDVFFAGELADRPRARAAAELRALAAVGVAIDMPEERLPPDEFHRRMARARLAWSPAGLGWHCFRHAEAAAAGSVPLIPYATVETAAGFVHGTNALFYDTQPGGLAATVRDALGDHARLARIAAAARAHALANLTPEAVAARVLEEALRG